MIDRTLLPELLKSLRAFPAIALLGARQTGKTTLAKIVAARARQQGMYLDLENPIDREKLHDPYTFLDDNRRKLVVLDEVQRMPELFAVLRSLIDAHRKPGRFLLLGSASPQLVKGVSESLASRILTAQLHPVNLLECPDGISMKRHWFRGGFPEMLTSRSDALFAQRMDSFITTFIERDLQSLFGVSFTGSVMRRFWQMLAHANGSIWNGETYARSLGITSPTVRRYLDYLQGAFMVQTLPAFTFNARKRLIKAPKVYVCDTGVMHRLVRINKYEDLQCHPAAGASWEAYVIQQILRLKPAHLDMFYYRTQNGAEADVVLTDAGTPLSCIEIKLSNAPVLSKGFYQSIDDLETKRNFVVIPDGESRRQGPGITVSGAREFLAVHLRKLKR
jgi:uncharacterized protein